MAGKAGGSTAGEGGKYISATGKFSYAREVRYHVRPVIKGPENGGSLIRCVGLYDDFDCVYPRAPDGRTTAPGMIIAKGNLVHELNDGGRTTLATSLLKEAKPYVLSWDKIPLIENFKAELLEIGEFELRLMKELPDYRSDIESLQAAVRRSRRR